MNLAAIITNVRVERALLDHGGRIVYSCELDDRGRTVPPPQPPKQRRNRIEAAKAELQRRIAERRAKARAVIDAKLRRR